VGGFADLLKLSTKERWALRLLDLDIDTSTSMGEAAAFVIATFAQAERKRIGAGQRTGLGVVSHAKPWPSPQRFLTSESMGATAVVGLIVIPLTPSRLDERFLINGKRLEQLAHSEC
jgi:hypothetical protein